MKSEVISTYLKMMTALFTILSPCFNVRCATLSGTLSVIASSFAIDPGFVNLKSEEVKSNCPMSESEALKVKIEALDENYCGDMVEEADMVRYNLYRACFLQLQRSFVRLRRVLNLFKDFYGEAELS